MRKKEAPVWFKVETLAFLFFSVAIIASFMKMSGEMNDQDSKQLLIKLVILMSSILLVWIISLIACCRK